MITNIQSPTGEENKGDTFFITLNLHHNFELVKENYARRI